MKWYFAINEQGTGSKVGWHARLAVVSALAQGGLEPILLYSGRPNDFTAWMEARGVRVLVIESRLAPAVHALEAREPGYGAFLGHWLRSSICLWEWRDEFVLYTDCDVVFLHRPNLTDVRPEFIACAPEFGQTDWSYFNSGVMVMNVPALRQDYQAFERFILDRMAEPDGAGFLDQDAYNAFYAGRWLRLDPRLNWKPYWGFDVARADRQIVHFHGPKLPETKNIMAGIWPLRTPFEIGMGRMFAAGFEGYRGYARYLAESGWDLPGDIAVMLREIVEAAESFDVARYRLSLPQ